MDSEIIPAALTITADDATKTYGDTVTFAGTEFTTSGLLGSDSVDSVTLNSAGAAATATVAGSPYAIVASAAVGTGLANYTITYVDGALTVDPAALTITADDQSKAFGVPFAFAGTEFSTAGLVNGDSVDSATLTSPGAATFARSGHVPDLDLGRRRDRPRQLHDHVRAGHVHDREHAAGHRRRRRDDRRNRRRSRAPSR